MCYDAVRLFIYLFLLYTLSHNLESSTLTLKKTFLCLPILRDNTIQTLFKNAPIKRLNRLEVDMALPETLQDPAGHGSLNITPHTANFRIPYTAQCPIVSILNIHYIFF